MATGYLEHTVGTPDTNGNKKLTFSAWIKRSNVDTEQAFYVTRTNSSNFVRFRFLDTNYINITSNTSGTNYYATTNRLFRDTSAWYHIVVAYDTTQASSADRIKMYVNGTQQTFSNAVYPAQDATLYMLASGQPQRIGQESGNAYFDGYMSHVHYTEGHAYAASTFGETDSTSGIWKPKTAPSVTYGTNGFFLKMENSGAMGTDSSGNSNTFTVGGGTLTQNVDTPSNNFPIISKVMQPSLASNATLSNGNLTSTSNTSDYTILCSMGAKKGKWYWEVKMGNAGNTRSPGVVRADKILISGNSSGFYPGGDGNATNFTSAWNGSTGFVQTNTDGTQTQVTSNVTTLASGDIAGVALDLDNYTLKFYKNGTLDGTATLSAAWIEDFVLPCARADHNQIMHFNFGSGFFGTTAVTSANADANGHGAMEYAVPSGYYTLNTKNLKEFG